MSDISCDDKCSCINLPTSSWWRVERHPNRGHITLILCGRPERLPPLLFSKLDLLLILSDDTTAAAHPLDAIPRHVTRLGMHVESLAHPCMLDRDQYSVESTQDGKGDTGAVHRRVSEHVGRVSSLASERQSILRASVDYAWAEDSGQTDGRFGA